MEKKGKSLTRPMRHGLLLISRYSGSCCPRASPRFMHVALLQKRRRLLKGISCLRQELTPSTPGSPLPPPRRVTSPLWTTSTRCASWGMNWLPQAGQSMTTTSSPTSSPALTSRTIRSSPHSSLRRISPSVRSSHNCSVLSNILSYKDWVNTMPMWHAVDEAVHVAEALDECNTHFL
jgi:hypothetical protein